MKHVVVLDRSAATLNLDASVRNAFGVDVRFGALGIHAPSLRQGRHDTVTVLISREPSAPQAIATLLTGSQTKEVFGIQTTALMTVDLRGDAFDIRRLNALGVDDAGEQLVSGTTTWEFDVVPKKHGRQELTVSASMRLPIPGVGEKTKSLPSLTQPFDVQVDRLYGPMTFTRAHWQWVLTTVIALVAAAAGLVEVLRR